MICWAYPSATLQSLSQSSGLISRLACLQHSGISRYVQHIIIQWVTQDRAICRDERKRQQCRNSRWNLLVSGDLQVLPTWKLIRAKSEMYFWAFTPQQRWRAYSLKQMKKKHTTKEKYTEMSVHPSYAGKPHLVLSPIRGGVIVTFSSKRIFFFFFKRLWERRIVWIESLRCCITESHRKCTMQMTICLIRCLNRVHCLDIAIIGDGWTLHDFTIELKNFSVSLIAGY